MRAWSILLLLLVITPGTLRAQLNPDPIATYRFNLPVPLHECEFTGSELSQSITYAPGGSRFYALGAGPNEDKVERIRIQFLNWVPNVIPDSTAVGLRGQKVSDEALLQRQEENRKYMTFNYGRGTLNPQAGDHPLVFCIEKSLFDRMTTRTYDKGFSTLDLAAGVLILPIKLRAGAGQPFDFSKDVTIGTVAGPRMRISETREAYISLLGGAGITAVSLTPENTGGKVTTATDRAAVTLSLGPMFEFNRFQVGIMVGWDRISNPNQDDWRYQGKHWFSIGLGYSLLSAPPSPPASNEQK